MTERTAGGLRTNGLFHKKSNPDHPLVSIITVVRNGEKYLEQTIKSVIYQTYDNVEYIIIDGGSTDGTLDIIRKYDDKIAYWVSEPDDGLYDAMNKGSNIASGDYALYLNAGDYFYQNDTVQQSMHHGLDRDKYPLLICGKAIVAINNELIDDWILPVSERWINKYDPHHQATFIGSHIYKKVPYRFLFAGGDYEFWLRVRKLGLFQVKHTDTIVSVFRMGGISTNTKLAFPLCFLRETLQYQYTKKFNTSRLLKNLIFVIMKICFISIFGERLYYRYVLYSVYLLRKKFL